MLIVSVPARSSEAPPEAGEPPRKTEITTPGEAKDPLQEIGKEMRKSQTILAAAKRDRDVTSVQEKIVADLDQLIARARKTAVRSSEKDPSKSTSRTPLGSVPKPGGEGGKPGDMPAAKSGDRTASTPGKLDATARATDGMNRVWGKLPPRERQKVLELKAEDFVPKYRTMIEEYYRRLATGGE
jgi:hypothetical protein